MDDQVEHAQREPESEAGSSVEHFSELAEVLVHAVEAIEDQDNSDGDVFGGSISLSLPEVFDLDNSYWMDTWKGLAMRNLVDETEFDELMDLDGNAEVDNGNEADITLASSYILYLYKCKLTGISVD
ncbi:hypothetical protein Agabi119p4_5212 [Agaricus bisporus var. burnettii]|uniref:Uncharacterized protein n=1 Tax=Agaricus bisporus var. burnettii TaxID=192524 RepID=A0A8H7KHP1_AGABI|nr:hypothetical protein Agabi119p4_5212 [Agaricus bisporus var. burnettii]